MLADITEPERSQGKGDSVPSGEPERRALVLGVAARTALTP